MLYDNQNKNIRQIYRFNKKLLYEIKENNKTYSTLLLFIP